MPILCCTWPQVGELFSFHVVLLSKGMTTYEYIMAQRDKQSLEGGGGLSGGWGDTLGNAKSVLTCICCFKPSRVSPVLLLKCVRVGDTRGHA